MATKYNVTLEIIAVNTNGPITTTDSGVLDALFMKKDLHFKGTVGNDESTVEFFIPFHAVSVVTITRSTSEVADPVDRNCTPIPVGCDDSTGDDSTGDDNTGDDNTGDNTDDPTP